MPLPSFTLPTSPTTHSDPLPTHDKACHLISSSSDPYAQVVAEATSRRKTHRRVDARRWSFLLPIIRRWRFQEGAPSTAELGESSSAVVSRSLPVTGEPLHHTVPLLAARLARHEDRLDYIVGILNDLPSEQVEILGDEVENLVIGQLAMEIAFDHMGTQLEEVRETMTVLRDDVSSMQTAIEALDSVVDQLSSQVLIYRLMIEDLRARDRARDQTVEILMDMVMSLQRRLDGAPRGP